MIDAETVLQTLQSGVVPQTWQVFRPKRRYVRAFELGIPLLWAVAALCQVGTDILEGSVPTVFLVLNGVCGTVMLCCIVALLYFYFDLKRAGDRRVIVVAPEEFLEFRYGSAVGALAVSFADPVTLQPPGLSGSRSFVLRTVEGTYTEWQPYIVFGRREPIIECILAARDTYVAEHGNRQVGGPQAAKS